MSHQRLLRILAFCLIIAPAFFLAFLILKYSVDVPYWDQIDMAASLDNFFTHHNLSFSDLIGQHTESRKFFPRLLYIGLAYLTHWDVRYEMLVTFIFACIVSFNVYYLTRLTVGKDFGKGFLVLLLCNLLIFSPIQFDIWLWGIQVETITPITCISTSIVVAYSKINQGAKLAIAIILATISTFTYANGIVAWIVILPVLALSKSWRLDKFFDDKRLFVGWIVAAVANLSLYFYKYQKPADSPSFLAAIFQPIQALHFFFAFLGGPLGLGEVKSWLRVYSDVIYTSTAIGIVLFTLFLGSCFYLIKHSKDSGLIYRMTAWLLIGSYTVVSGIIVTLGRVGIGVAGAIPFRYMTYSIYLAVSVVPLIAILIDDVKEKGYLLNSPKKIAQIFTAIFLVIFINFYMAGARFGIEKMKAQQVERLQGKACLVFINIVMEEKCLKEKIFPREGTFVRDRFNSLNKGGLINWKLLDKPQIKEIAGINKAHKKYGDFEGINGKENSEYEAFGWAIWPQKGRPADAVVLTYENSQKEDIIFAVSDQITKRKDVAKSLKKKAYKMSGWIKSFPANRLPKGILKINAWAFDTDTGKAFKLKGTHILKNP